MNQHRLSIRVRVVRGAVRAGLAKERVDHCHQADPAREPADGAVAFRAAGDGVAVAVELKRDLDRVRVRAASIRHGGPRHIEAPWAHSKLSLGRPNRGS